MKISIIAVGSELLLGQIANTNGQYLSKLLNGVGHSVVEHTVIGDNPERLERVIKASFNHYDTVILTGGLGPTKDDLTKHTVAKVLGRELVIDKHALNYIEQFFEEQNIEMTPNNRQQALVIEGSHVLENKVGMAPGMLVDQDERRIVLLPGPPREMQPMAKNELLPFFFNGESTIFSELLRFAGIGESKVETVLMDLIDGQTNPTIAPLAGTHEVNIRLTANGDTQRECEQLIAPIKAEILSRIGEYYYGSDDILLEQSLMDQIHQSFAIYDAVTDGELYSRLQNFNTSQLLQGMLPHHTQFIDERDTIETQLSVSANIVKALYQTEVGISIMKHKDKIYLGILENERLGIQSFKMTQRRNSIKSRTQNFVLIRLLNWFK
ncbi:CinA family nicotinamide mononucleotide deamidase-related protein [Staphylococcus equorum]|uniref:Putative competence-damage inducible protein n=1 Tax=Staphylococcus equorum TaxID=246432 RepID=A0AAP7IEB9_9STAP|nr:MULTISPECIES: CinA family nicotinamide mononucleotide deamidase-related protein [Staphylococcus]ANK37459.1 competence damage-inducible protein A [Staphylococcus sp. AntiMn-1]ANR67969.1 competence/damage-inducible protein A [Staphylococcus equorum]ERH36051.1 competence protein CinA [Staphylococcus equorum UMC-CNS-924]KKI54189.1 Competence/damage-inducible protein CinA [Staphylococcus equorum subsp. equorum]MCE5047200.1 CinA family nicotinamide mononucleotide deamidase-related protein [Staphy